MTLLQIRLITLSNHFKTRELRPPPRHTRRAVELARSLTRLFLRHRHHHVSDDDFLCLQQLQHLDTLEVLDSYYRPDPTDPSWVVYEPSPRLLQLKSDLQRLTNHRVGVVTSSRRDLLACQCV